MKLDEIAGYMAYDDLNAPRLVNVAQARECYLAADPRRLIGTLEGGFRIWTTSAHSDEIVLAGTNFIPVGSDGAEVVVAGQDATLSSVSSLPAGRVARASTPSPPSRHGRFRRGRP